jgi:putative transposase
MLGTAKRWQSLSLARIIGSGATLKRAADKLQQRIVRLVDDAHQHLANFLCDNFEVVLIPRFATSEMVRRAGRRIGRKTARQLLQTWAHYRFLQCLLYTAKRKGTTVTIVSEAYTTQCCPCCGTLHKKIGGAKAVSLPPMSSVSTLPIETRTAP